MTVTSDAFLEMIDRLPEVHSVVSPNYTTFKVRDRSFGYLWEATQTVGLKQPLEEQLALVAERPDVFEIQFTAGQFGWVVVHLAGIDADELAELLFEAWRLTAPPELVESHGDRLPL
ncbi:MmcQ/YjbR family DNA-binding protein [Phytoactinopolyspora halotolerans]|uniref:MmcQ/YjbR family DNA-binding protein n=1 Tax=Phytoactinopolyspora halotolerans TaxID=1981512 RepID=A0A6L9S8E3_9ACTN|nr:MmcQ/YjbR family DNA-binding protein [Phytoactinopolyspora halotolerans]NEE01476.1 MmcQ/YjbR family DNA-binding protein [Phytoactinopolyspora halotolerans]